MKLLSIMMIAGSLLFGPVAFGKAACETVQGMDTVMSPDPDSILVKTALTSRPSDPVKDGQGEP